MNCSPPLARIVSSPPRNVQVIVGFTIDNPPRGLACKQIIDIGGFLMKRRDIFILCCLIFGLLCPVSAKPLSSEKILFSSNRDGNWEIYIMNPEGVIGNNSQIVKINLISQKATQLTKDGSNYAGNWFAPKQLPVSPSTSLLSTSWGDVKSQTK